MTSSRKELATAVLHAVQALALIAGGCWVIFNYLSYEREAQQLVREQQRFTNAQMVTLASTQRKSEEAKLRQVELSNEQTRLSASIQKEQQDLSLALQKLGVQQAGFALRIAQSQERLRTEEMALSVRVQKLESEKREHDLAYSTTYRFEPTHGLKAKKRRELGNGLAEYELTYWFKITNRSTTPSEVSFYVVDLYVGEPRQDNAVSTVRRMNLPNLRNFTLGPERDDAIAWKHVNAIGAILQTESSHHGPVLQPPWSEWPPVDLKLNALGLKQLKNGEWSSRSERYFITAPSSSYVAAVIAYCFNSCRQQEDGFTGSNVVALADAEEIESPKKPLLAENAPLASEP